MSKIKTIIDYHPANGKQLSFRAPCSSIDTDGLLINNVEYTLVDADGNNIAGTANLWNSGAMVSVILDTVNTLAYIQNANTNGYLEAALQEAARMFLVTVNGNGADKTTAEILSANIARRAVRCKYGQYLLQPVLLTASSCKFGCIDDNGAYLQVSIDKTGGAVVVTNELGTIKTVNGSAPDEQGNVTVDVPAPVKGVDYYTPEDKAEFDAVIAEELAKRGQLKPEFANTIEECTDTTKLYVLPDGYLYAYVTTEVTEEVIKYINQLDEAKEADDTPYNGGQGWKANTRLSSSYAEKEATGIECTGYIKFQPRDLSEPSDQSDTPYPGDIIRFENITFQRTSVNADKCYFVQYDGEKVPLNQWNVSAFNDAKKAGWAILDENENIKQINTTDKNCIGVTGYKIHPDARFFRISADEINADSVITINQEIKPTIVTTKKQAWANTGHAFVPADYEDRIIAVEATAKANKESTDSHEARILELEKGSANGASDGIPEYVIAEAESVINRVIVAQRSRTFTFAAITDMHYGNGGNTDGVKHLVKALKYIDKRVKLDAVAVLGDYTDGYPASGYDNAVQDFRTVNAELDDLRFAPNLRTQGNHDYYANHTAMTHRHIQMYSEGVVWGSVAGGYYYRDFDGFKVRVIVLNTSETGNDYVRCSPAQYQWFVNSLDLSGKDDATDWQILVLSHYPPDWWTANDKYYFSYIMDAYANGTSWASGDVSCDYSGKNAAKLIGCIHGHIHNLLTDYVYLGKINDGGTPSSVLRMCTPEACIGRANQYAAPWADETTYAKTAGTAEETAGCVFCIDLDNHVIRAICYGAGYDREISY